MPKTLVYGKKRFIELDLYRLIKHSDVVAHWADGGDIEELSGQDWVSVFDNPRFDINTVYKSITKEPKCGEVWVDPVGSAYIATSNKTFQSLNGGEFIGTITSGYPEGFSYAAKTVSEYISN